MFLTTTCVSLSALLVASANCSCVSDKGANTEAGVEGAEEAAELTSDKPVDDEEGATGREEEEDEEVGGAGEDCTTDEYERSSRRARRGEGETEEEGDDDDDMLG